MRDVHTDAVLGVEASHLGRDHRTGVVAHRPVALVAEPVHQLDPGPGDPDVVPAGLGRRAGEPVAGIDGMRSKPASVRLDDVEVLEDGPGPAVGEDEREPVRRPDRAWMKWTFWPSIVVVNCG